MANLKLVIEYDGTRYQGFIRQQKGKEPSVEEKFIAIAERLSQQEVKVSGAVRLEKGVHAVNMVLNCKCELPTELQEAKRLKKYFNEYLPKDITVLSLSIVDERFDSNLNKKGLRFAYEIQTGDVQDVFGSHFSVYLPQFKNLEEAEQAAKLLSGKKDYKMFSATKSKKNSTIRTVKMIQIMRQDSKCIIRIEVDNTMPGMILGIVGAIIGVGSGQVTLDQLQAMLAEETQWPKELLAPAKGLMLTDVLY